MFIWCFILHSYQVFIAECDFLSKYKKAIPHRKEIDNAGKTKIHKTE